MRGACPPSALCDVRMRSGRAWLVLRHLGRSHVAAELPPASNIGQKNCNFLPANQMHCAVRLHASHVDKPHAARWLRQQASWQVHPSRGNMITAAQCMLRVDQKGRAPHAYDQVAGMGKFKESNLVQGVKLNSRSQSQSKQHAPYSGMSRWKVSYE